MAGKGESPLDPRAVADGLTIWASPGVVADPARPDLGLVAALTCLPSRTAYTGDEREGAEPVDVVASSLLGQGFALLTAFDAASMVALPIPSGWVGALTPDVRHLTVVAPGGVFYDGDLAAEVPPRWSEAVDRRGLLVLLVSTGTALPRPGQVTSMEAARRAGNIVAAQIRVQRHR
jgi:hypothetical protein